MECYPALFKTYFKLEANFIITSCEILSYIILMVVEQTSNKLLLFLYQGPNLWSSLTYSITQYNLITFKQSLSHKSLSYSFTKYPNYK